MNGVKAAIFDMDGLMLDTERLGLEHFKKTAEELGYPEIIDVYLQTVGRNRVDTRRIFVEALGEGFPFDMVHQKWRQYFNDHVTKVGVPVKAGLHLLLEQLTNVRISKAVATSTSKPSALRLLKTCDLVDCFEAIVGGNEVSQGKPHPEIFLTAAERLRVAPSDCVVFEDSAAGIEGAHAAGMISILVPDVVAISASTRALAYKVVNNLQDCIPLFQSK